MKEDYSAKQKRKHLSIDPKPMYVENERGHAMYEEMGLNMESMRVKSQLNVADKDNASGKRGRGGY